MILQKDTKDLFLNSEISLNQLKDMFGEYSEWEKEYDDMWDSWILQESIAAHETYGGIYSGSGTLDYIEGKILYFLVRQKKPQCYLEIGTAQGVSTAIVAEAIEKNNNSGYIIAVDKNKPSTPCPHFTQQTNIAFFQEDALDFVKAFDKTPDIIFVDADHQQTFCMAMAELLKEKWPNSLVAYHEWSLSPISNKPETDYISRQEWVGKLYERVAFETVYNEKKYQHYGFIGSCGIGRVVSENLF